MDVSLNPLDLRIWKERWIAYDRVIELHQHLHALMAMEPSSRPLSLCVVGETNNGKTRALQRFVERCAPHENPNGDASYVPVVYVNVPPCATEKGLYRLILREITPTLRKQMTREEMRDLLRDLASQHGLRMIIIDELQHLLDMKSKQAELLFSIRWLSSTLRIPVVCAGIETVRTVLSNDSQTANRFPPFELDRWGDEPQMRRTRQLIQTYVRAMGFDEGVGTDDQAIARRVVALSEGLLGEIIHLLKLAATKARASDPSRRSLQIDDFDDLAFVPPRQRGKAVRLRPAKDRGSSTRTSGGSG